jgi:hypothetical protein
METTQHRQEELRDRRERKTGGEKREIFIQVKSIAREIQQGHKEKEVAVYSDLQCTISHRHYFFFGGGGVESRLTAALPLSRTIMILPLKSRVGLEYASIHRVNVIKSCLGERTILEID